MRDISIKEWTEEDFANSRSEWSELLLRSDADKLFMSWEWHYSWWNTFSNDSMILKLLVAYEKSGRLVGVAPMYISRAKVRDIFSVMRLQSIGNCWRGSETMRTELFSFIVDAHESGFIITSLFKYIYEAIDWDELVLTDLIDESATCRILKVVSSRMRSYCRVPEEGESYYLSTAGCFEDYLSGRGKNTRLHMYNRRKLLDTIGRVRFERYTGVDIEDKFDLLNLLHAKRWGKFVFADKKLVFNQRVAKLMAEKGGVNFSTISVNDSVVSIQYNFVVDGHEYNIQSGFEEGFHKKISLGYLHFGFEIENAFQNEIKVYDFLVGEGKKSQYKTRLTESSKKLINLHIVRGWRTKILYKFYDLIRKCKLMLFL